MKVFLSAIRSCPDEELGAILEVFSNRLGTFMQSTHVEVQERASTLKHLMVSYGIMKEVEVVKPPAKDLEKEEEEKKKPGVCSHFCVIG